MDVINDGPAGILLDSLIFRGNIIEEDTASSGNNLSEGRRYEPSVVDEVWCFSYTDAKSRLSYQLGMALRVKGEWEIVLAHEHGGAFSADCS